MLVARINFELQIIYDRINEMIPDYEAHKSIRQEHITGVKFNKTKRFVTIKMNTYGYKISRSEDDNWEVSWYRVNPDNPKIVFKDGSQQCIDLSRVIQTIDSFLYANFCPDRSGWWMYNKKPKHFGRKRSWG